jgi:hypothetical protein
MGVGKIIVICTFVLRTFIKISRLKSEQKAIM